MKKRIAAFLVLILMLVSCTAFADDPFAGMLTYDESLYYVGIDMQPGEYVLISTSDYSGYFCVSTDANQDDITFNGLFETNSIITVERGEYVKLSRCVAVRSSDFYSRYSIKQSNYGTMLKVGYGYDLTPGTYRLKCEPGSDFDGYYCIYNSSRQDKIVSNDLFSGSSYVTVSEGQYLVLSRCCIVD